MPAALPPINGPLRFFYTRPSVDLSIDTSAFDVRN
jgi:hypothetical protein